MISRMGTRVAQEWDAKWRAPIRACILTSRGLTPELEQEGLGVLKHLAESFGFGFDLFGRRVAIFYQKTIGESPIQGGQRLNNVVTADDLAMIGDGEFVDHAHP